MATYKRFHVDTYGDATEIALIDSAITDPDIQHELESELIQFVDAERPMKLLVNFAAVGHCTSGAVNGLLRIRKTLAEYDGRMKLYNMQRVVRETLQLLNLEGTYFDIYDSRVEALNAF